MRKLFAISLTVITVGAGMLCGSWTVASAGSNRSDFALFDGTNPTTEAPPFGGAECSVNIPPGAATLYVSVYAHKSGPDGVVRATFADGDIVEFPIKSNGSFSFTEAIGGTPGVDDRIRISNGGNAAGARLVGWVSILGTGNLSCQSCNFNDGAGDGGCLNNP